MENAKKSEITTTENSDKNKDIEEDRSVSTKRSLENSEQNAKDPKKAKLNDDILDFIKNEDEKETDTPSENENVQQKIFEAEIARVNEKIKSQTEKINLRVSDGNLMTNGCRSVDNYKKIGKIQEGAYGVVFKAQCFATKEIVALKRVKMEKEKEGFPLTSIREIKVLMAFKHENIVDVKEIVVGKEIDKTFIVMEFVDHDLKKLMEKMKQPFAASVVKSLIQQLLKGVAWMHNHWILHRDLKSSNLLYSNSGILKIADFGLAREYGDPLQPYTPLVVTLGYRAPELLLGAKKYSTAIDMWSVGVIFGEFINKEAPLQGKIEIELLKNIFTLLGSPTQQIWPGYQELPNVKIITFPEKPYSTLRQKFPNVTENAYDLLNRLLAYDPQKRISAQEALNHPYFTEFPVPAEIMPTWPST